jgi:predicted transcriptional regulator
MPTETPKPKAGSLVEPEHLPDAELEVLACLWNRGAATAAEVREALAEFRPMAHGSVLTLLKRLGDKGLVAREKAGKGKAFVYRPTRRPQPVYRRILDELRRRVFGGNSVALVASLLESQTPSPEEIRQIKQMLDELEKGHGPKGASK